MSSPASPLDIPFLPFRIRPAFDEDTIRRAAALRQEAYGRHLPQFSSSLNEPEPEDTAAGCALFVAESRLDDSILGSVRIHTNFFAPLPLEKSLALPPELAKARVAEGVRLSVARDRPGNMVKALLCKAYYMFCVQEGLEHFMLVGRAPLDRQYEGMGFSDVYPGQGFLPMAHIGGLPHRVLSQEVSTCMDRLLANGHPFHKIFQTDYADFDISAPPHFYADGADPIEAPFAIQIDQARL